VSVAVALSGKQRRQLRALGHHRAVVVQVGVDGVTAGILAALAQALIDHELVKVRIDADREGRAVVTAALAEGTGAEVVQSLGRTLLLYRARKENPTLVLK
jgi:RNA-binding protein